MNLKIELFCDLFDESQIDDIEITPCKIVRLPDFNAPYEEEEFVEKCEEGEEDFWSIYTKFPSGERQCVADCDTKEDAEKLQKLLLLVGNKFIKN